MVKESRIAKNTHLHLRLWHQPAGDPLCELREKAEGKAMDINGKLGQADLMYCGDPCCIVCASTDDLVRI